jgi:hypothetical protein
MCNVKPVAGDATDVIIEVEAARAPFSATIVADPMPTAAAANRRTNAFFISYLRRQRAKLAPLWRRR